MKANDEYERFIRHTAANVRYWLGRTRDIHRIDLAGLVADRQNIYRAVQVGLSFPQTWLDSAHLVLQSWYFIERRGYWRDWIPVLEQAIDGCDDAHLARKCQLLNRLGQSQCLNRGWEEAVTTHQQAKSIAEQIGDELLAAQSRYYLCYVYSESRRYDEAERHGLEALATFMRIAPESIMTTAALNELGRIARWRGNLETAENRFSETVARWREFDDPTELGNALSNLAETLQAAGRFEEASSHYQEAIPLLRSAGSKIKMVMAQTNLGALHYQMGEYTQAEMTFRQIDLAHLRQIGHIYYQAVIAQSLGNVLLAQGRLGTADSYLRQSHDLWRQLDDEINLANTLGTLAETAVAQGKMAEAIPLYDEACGLLAGYPDHTWARKLLGEFTEAHRTLIKAETE